MPDEPLSIGRFARLCRLSVKQLRHYDQLGLLPPAHVDAGTGYRSYTRGQVRDAMAIALLRLLDVPLATIAETLAGDDADRTRVLRGERDRIEAQLARQHRLLGTVERLLDEGLLSREVTLAREPARRLLVVRATCPVEEIGAATTGCITRLAAAGAVSSGPVWGLFPVDLEPEMNIAAGVESGGTAPGTSVEVLPGGTVAVATHLGAYEQLPLTYHALFAWIHERGLLPYGPVREAYLTDPTTTDPAQSVTRVVVPVNEEESS